MVANTTKQYTILTITNVKGGNIKLVELVILEETASHFMFLEFVKILLKDGTL